MVGGRNYHRSQFNLATQGERQPGSAFKPFVLATALQSGIAPSTTFVSHPVTIDAGGRLWHVNNYEGDYLGTIDLSTGDRVLGQHRLRAAHEHRRPGERRRDGEGARDHDAAQRLLLDRARRRAGDAARDGARVRDASPTAATGIDGVASSGTSRAVVDCRRDEPGELRARTTRPCRASRARRTAGGDRSTSSSRASCSYGTGKAAQLPGLPVAGKTGTTENYGDAWFVGYTPELVTAVWVGYPDELRPMLTEYHGRAGRRRHVPGADLEGVHGEGAAVPA